MFTIGDFKEKIKDIPKDEWKEYITIAKCGGYCSDVALAFADENTNDLGLYIAEPLKEGYVHINLFHLMSTIEQYDILDENGIFFDYNETEYVKDAYIDYDKKIFYFYDEI